ncbi:MAG: Hsp70 family protein [Legionellales bacterium]|nr:Hsp70 family protein [Legionellales bacterium]
MANEKHLLSRLMYVLQHRLGHSILETVEKSKQLLSNQLETTLDLAFIENDLNVLLTRSLMNELLAEYIQKIVAKILQTIEQAGVKPTDINAVFYTGGSTKIPAIRNTINPLFPKADIVQGDAFGSVGLGLTIEAERQYGTIFQK